MAAADQASREGRNERSVHDAKVLLFPRLGKRWNGAVAAPGRTFRDIGVRGPGAAMFAES
jgi:hypothetical protein